MNQYKILIVEDEFIAALELETRLQSKGYKYIKTTPTGEQAIDLASQTDFNLILMDIKLAGQIDGIEAAKQIHSYCETPIIYITGNSNFKTDERLLATQPFEVLIKPVPDWQLFEIMGQALSNRN